MRRFGRSTGQRVRNGPRGRRWGSGLLIIALVAALLPVGAAAGVGDAASAIGVEGHPSWVMSSDREAIEDATTVAESVEPQADAPPVAVEIPGPPGYAEEFVDLGNLAMFIVDTSQALPSQQGLWATDGTEEGTLKIDLPEGQVARPGRRFQTEGSQSTVRDGLAYFPVGERGSTSNQPIGDPDLWVSDGTQAGTERLDINDSFDFIEIHDIATFGDRIAVYARHQVGDDDVNEVFLLDDSPEGAATLGGGWLGDSPPRFAVQGDDLYLASSDGLDRVDQAGTRTTVWELDQDSGADFAPSRLTAAGDKVFFLAEEGGVEGVYVSDGTSDGTSRVTPEDLAIFGLPMVAAGDQVFFFAGSGRRTLWVSDGTTEGTQEVWPEELGAGYTSFNLPDEDQVIAAGDWLTFPVPGSGSTRWTTNGDLDATEPLLLDGESLGSGFGISGGDEAWLLGPDRTLVRTDGTSAGTVAAGPEELRLFQAVSATFYPIGLVGDIPIFNGDTGFEDGQLSSRRLWRIDAEGPSWPGGSELDTTSIGSTFAALEWPAATGDEEVTGYRVLADGEPVARTDAATTTATIDRLDSDEAISFEVQAIAGFGALSDPLMREVTLEEEAEPGTALLEATAAPGVVELDWTALPEADSYTVYRAVGGDAFTELADGVTATSFTDEGPDADTTYRYEVRAVVDGAEQPHTVEAQATTLAISVDAPTGVPDAFARGGTPDVTLLGTELRVNVTGDPHRTATATVSYTDTDDLSQTATLGLAEEFTGTYQDSFTLAEGVATIESVEAELCDAAGTCAEASTTLDLVNGASLAIDLDVPDGALDGGRLSVLDDGGRGDVATVDADGRARVDRLVPADGYQVRVDDPGGRQSASATVDVAPGTVSQPDPDVTLYERLRVRVRYADGTPVGDARIAVRDGEGEQIFRSFTLDNGERISSSPVPEGSYDLTITDRVRSQRAEPSAETPIEVAYGDEDFVTVVLPDLPDATVTGTVKTADGDPAPWATITVTQTVDGYRWTTRASADGDGRYEATVLAGDMSIVATSGQSAVRRSATVGAGGTTVADITLDPERDYDFEIEVRTDYAGEGLSPPLNLDLSRSVFVYEITVNGREVRGTRHVLPGPQGEPVEVCVTGPPDLTSECADVQFPGGDEPGRVELVLTQLGAVQGTVVVPGGTPTRLGTTARLYRIDSAGRSHVLTQTGRSDLRLSVPEPGEYEVVVEVQDRTTAPVRVSVGQGETVDLGDLTLQAPGWFAQSSLVTSSVSSVLPGERVTWRAEYRNDGDTAQDARLVFDVPAEATLLDRGVTVDGAERALADLDREGSAYALDLGDVAPGDSGVVRYVVEVDADAIPGRIDAGVRMHYDAEGPRTEEFGSAAVTVSSLRIDAPRTTTRRDVPLSGRAPADAVVEVFDGDALIGETRATAGGYWTMRAELVDRGDDFRHRVHARVATGDLRSGEAVVHYDADAPQPINVAVQHAGATHSFDPAQGVDTFMFPHNSRAPLFASVSFDHPDRVRDPHMVVGPARVPMTFENGTFRAAFRPLADTGPISIDYDTVAAPIDLGSVIGWMSDQAIIRNRLPRVLDDTAAGDFAPLGGATEAPIQLMSDGGDDELIDGDGDDVSDFDIEEEDYDEGFSVDASTSRFGLSINTTIVASEIADYQPTAADLAYEARTGLPVYDRSSSWSLTSDTFRFVGGATIPVDELPEHEDPEAAMSAMLSASVAAEFGEAFDGEVSTTLWDGGEPDLRLASTRRAIKVTYEVVSAGSTVSDAFGALSGADRYEELGDLLDDIMDACTSGLSRDLYRGQLDRIAKQAAAHQIASVGIMVAGGAAAAATGGLLGIAAIGVTALVDAKLDQQIDDMIDNLKDRVAEDPDCEEEDDERERERDDDDDDPPLARPRWIGLFDPAGYVFEAVESNRLEDATVTVYEGDPADGAASDVESWSAWPAELFGQVNPQVTVADGRYAWDTPEGWWRTEAEVDGYRPVTSEVMRVLPEHFDVHLNMVSLEDPSVESVDAWAAGDVDPAEIIVEFDHWMRGPGMADRISVVDGDDQPVTGSVSPIDGEEHSTGRMSEESAGLVAPDGELVAERFGFRPDEPWSVGDELTVTVDGLAQGYHLKVVGDDQDFGRTVRARPPSVTVDAATWLAEETVTGWLRGMRVDASIVDGGLGDIDAIAVTLVDDAQLPLAELAWNGASLGAGAAFTVPFDIDGWGTFDHAAQGLWGPGPTLDPWSSARVDRVIVEVVFDDGRTVTTQTATLQGDRSEVVPPFAPAASDDDAPVGGGETGPPDPPPSEREGSPVAFSDVDLDSTHGEAILAIASSGIALGYPDGTFRSDAWVDRAAMASFLQRALDLPDGDPSAFNDVRGTHAAAIGAIAQAGVALGYPDGTFRPDEPVGRGHMAAMLSRAGSLEASRPAAFTDTVGTTHEAAIDAVAEAEIARGFNDGTFRPSAPVTRGQMASFIHRWLEHLG